MITTNATTRSARKTPGVFLFILILIALSLFATIIRFQTDHGKRRHNSEPDLAERCLNRPGVAHAFVEAASGRIHLICTESETEIYDVIYRDRGTLDGITAFRVQSDTYRGTTYVFNTVDEYLEFLAGRHTARRVSIHGAHHIGVAVVFETTYRGRRFCMLMLTTPTYAVPDPLVFESFKGVLSSFPKRIGYGKAVQLYARVYNLTGDG